MDEIQPTKDQRRCRQQEEHTTPVDEHPLPPGKGLEHGNQNIAPQRRQEGQPQQDVAPPRARRRQGREWRNWIIVIFNILLFAATSFYAFYAWRQWKTLDATLKTTQVTADAAKQANILAERSTQETLESIRLDQRAWVAVREIVLIGDPSEGRPVDIKVFLINTGKTPARDLVGQVRVLMDKDHLARPEFAGLSEDHPRYTLAPGPTNIHTDRNNQRFPTEQVRQYREGGVRLYVHGRLFYKDVFGVTRQTSFCAFRAFGDEQETFTWCPRYNTIE